MFEIAQFTRINRFIFTSNRTEIVPLEINDMLHETAAERSAMGRMDSVTEAVAVSSAENKQMRTVAILKYDLGCAGFAKPNMMTFSAHC